MPPPQILIKGDMSTETSAPQLRPHFTPEPHRWIRRPFGAPPPYCREQFRNNGIRYDVSDLVKTDLYRELLPSIDRARIELLDHPRMVSQMLGLERRTARGGRDSIDHGPQGHDDLANVAAGVHYLMEKKRSEAFFI